jgi:hypothetical protein
MTRAIVVERTGGPEVLTLADRDHRRAGGRPAAQSASQPRV